MEMVSNVPAIGNACQCPAPGLSAGSRNRITRSLSLAPESGPQSEGPLQGTVMSPPTLTPGAEKLDGCAAVELEPEVQFGVAHDLAIQSSGQAELQDLTQIFADPGAGLAGPLTVLADTNSMILETGERILVGSGC